VPQRKTGIKELKKNKARQLHNMDIKTDLKKTIKAFLAAVASKPEEAKTLLSTLYKKLDKAAKRNVLNKNTASRRKARFAKLLVAKKA
jgi:small subunit ribosomal protein S20